MKSVGILTMHKVVNYGSALQAWATLEVIRKLGYKAELIDYTFPNDYHKKGKRKVLVSRVLHFLYASIQGFPQKKKQNFFERFWNENYTLSRKYGSVKEVMSDPPVYDIYVAGSDQIWNPRHTLCDQVFMLGFVKQGRKISYASSLAQSSLEHNAAITFKNQLKSFDAISVRENNGKILLEILIDKEVSVCLDPTLLLTKEDYEPLSKKSTIKIDTPYILVYILQYAFNPYPYTTQFIRNVHRQTGLRVVCLDFSSKQKLGIKQSVNLKDSVGPNEFIYLFKNASLVITTSFHGTAFALNFGVPVYCIVDNKSDSDDRMRNLMTACGLFDRIVPMNTDHINISLAFDEKATQRKLNELRYASVSFLKNNLLL